jgi:precorrin-2/cobalt-factor-2 C20-methyltransferase
MHKPGTLYGIGVGPGDPELITLKAKRVLERMKIIFAPVAGKDRESIACSIAQPYIAGDARVEKLFFPMTHDRAERERAWEDHARSISRVLDTGADAAFITLGDPMTYSTYGYLLKTMERLCPLTHKITIPGIPAYLAGAASANLPLAQGHEILAIVPGSASGKRIKECLASSDTIVFLKHSNSTRKIHELLQETDLQERAIYIRRLGFPDEMVTPDKERGLSGGEEYLSLIIVKKQSMSDP